MINWRPRRLITTRRLNSALTEQSHLVSSFFFRGGNWFFFPKKTKAAPAAEAEVLPIRLSGQPRAKSDSQAGQPDEAVDGNPPRPPRCGPRRRR